MTHIAHPYIQRIGISKDWKSRWFGSRAQYKEYLKADVLIREFLEKKLRRFYISSIEMERDEKLYRIIIKTSRAGMIIGRSGEGAQKLKDEILEFLRKRNLPKPKELKIDIEEIRYPEADAAIVALMVAESLEKRMPFRRVMKMTIDKVAANRDVLGVRIRASGRLGGTEMARREELKRGRVPLQTLRADIDFANEKAYLPYGVIGIKVWIYKGDIFNESKR
ncbi:MAG: 30S ribosomal protein S3 [Candidatus Pacebacteria bacterium]|nr:30S ribosomal protein S3 [Candidatus Paceibacterota bacterium]